VVVRNSAGPYLYNTNIEFVKEIDSEQKWEKG